ncbi:MAG: 2-C-methyl-D-erythritol 4-phosphate cytidylyltransferase [Zoogloeaceae bacterium]|jgi:2-C-methyl-D-erythritol 4-phosphate cytidylyltransferase|nr:2-C-methyl-D-erythritol 4-phosphate cytidylyltransferase [Zoogloeaceae bacterium]
MIAPHVYALVPAAGIGARFGGDTPKQYLALLGRPMIWYALAVLCAHPRIERVWVVISPRDHYWGNPDWRELWLSLGPRLEVVACGGGSRAESVRNGLDAAATAIAPDDWVLVHDAARPCLSVAMLDRLLGTLAEDSVGGLLAAPLADTLKHADAAERVDRTLPRAGLWRAQTPQMFRYGLLQAALAAHPDVTDEAGAMEAAGFAPRLVEGAEANLKVTHPADMALAAWILHGRGGAP